MSNDAPPVAAAPEPGWALRLLLFWRHKGYRLRVVTALMVVLGMLLVALLAGAVLWRAGMQSVRQSALLSAEASAALVQERSERMLQPTHAALRHLAGASLVRETEHDARLALLGPLRAELDANPLLDAMYVGWQDGDFLLIRPLRNTALRQRVRAPAEAQYLVQCVDRDLDTSPRGHFYFLGSAGERILERAEPDYRFDPRQRPWYLAARTPRNTASAPYVFFTSGELGLTLSRRVGGGAVVGVDVTLGELATTLRQLPRSPSTALALVDGAGQVMASTEHAPARAVDAQTLRPATLAELGHAGLLGARTQTEFDDAQGVSWVATRLALRQAPGSDWSLLSATPTQVLSAPLRARIEQLAAGLVLLVLALLPVGWWIGRAIGRSLDRLRERTDRIGRFDFAPQPLPATAITEVNALSQVVSDMGHTIESFLRLAQHMATEPEVGEMLRQVLAQFVGATRSRGAAVYLYDEQARQMSTVAATTDLLQRPPPQFTYLDERPRRVQPRALADGHSQLDLPLRSRTGVLLGLMVVEYANDSEHSDLAFARYAQQLSSMLAVAVEMRHLIEAQRTLFDAIVRLLADAIDAKSPYTGGHCERVPRLALALGDALHAQQEGPYADFRLSAAERYEFELGAWLHDAGKITSAESVVDKATKLHGLHDRIHEVRTRFELLHRDAEIEHLRRLLGGSDPVTSLQQRDARQAQLQEDFAFVAHCNLGGEGLDDAAVARLHHIGSRRWLRHFDDRLGLSHEEAARLRTARATAPDLPASEPLLADRPEHHIGWGEERPPVARDDPRNRFGFDMPLPALKQHLGELHNLSVRRGTLTEQDRFRVNDHIVQTYVMLSGLPWPEGLRRVPELAATHHERLDGQGYPRRLDATRLSVLDRVMALADVFEALTAADRPYKPAKTLSESFSLMVRMARDQHLDAELLRTFLRSDVWRSFAAAHLLPEQCDEPDLAALEAALDAPPKPRA